MFPDDLTARAVELIALLRNERLMLATAESCTGGLIANRITNVPGSSAVFGHGFVTYANGAKSSSLNVSADDLATHGAVSEVVAKQMAAGALQASGADIAVAVTGIAGPNRDGSNKPVGTVFIALASASGTQVVNPTNRYDRETFKYVTALQALELLRRAMR